MGVAEKRQLYVSQPLRILTERSTDSKWWWANTTDLSFSSAGFFKRVSQRPHFIRQDGDPRRHSIILPFEMMLSGVGRLLKISDRDSLPFSFVFQLTDFPLQTFQLALLLCGPNLDKNIKQRWRGDKRRCHEAGALKRCGRTYLVTGLRAFLRSLLGLWDWLSGFAFISFPSTKVNMRHPNWNSQGLSQVSPQTLNAINESTCDRDNIATGLSTLIKYDVTMHMVGLWEEQLPLLFHWRITGNNVMSIYWLIYRPQYICTPTTPERHGFLLIDWYR